MPQVVSVQKPSRQLRAAVIAGCGVVVVAIGVAAYILMHQPQPQPTMQEVADQTTTLQFQGKYEEAAKLSVDKFNKSKVKEDKYQLALNIGNIYENNKDYKTALSWYLKAKTYAKTDKDRGVSSGLARCYEQLGDNQKAADNYQIVIDLINHDKLGWEAELNWYTLALKRVKQ